MSRSPEYLCQHGNCTETENLRILVTDKLQGLKARFCGYPHAIAWMMRRIEIGQSAKQSAQLAVEGIVRIAKPIEEKEKK